MGKYMGMFFLGFIVVGAIVLGIAAVTGEPGISVPSWILAIVLALLGGGLCFAVSVRKDSH